jgi:hypothetical protein
MKKLRLCKINNNKAFFHRWSEVSQIIEPSKMIGGHVGGVVKRTVGIIEYVHDGSVHECYPHEIVFIKLDSEVE